MKHSFTTEIERILKKNYPKNSTYIFNNSELLQYLNQKTKSANKGAKARGSFGNIYSVYVLIEDYIKKGFVKSGKYSDYEGAKFSDIFKRQRELPFGAKLQNHALNHRLNQEFKKYFPTCDYIPIIRIAATNKYWINENLLKINVGRKKINVAETIIEVINAYIQVKKNAFDKFIKTCNQLKSISNKNKNKIIEFIEELLAPNVDARIFEIVSFAILKYFYHNQTVYFGFDLDSIDEENLKLYKTGRTNANDGGIDFVMKPLGRFFQVTETTDAKKYFLDIDKLEKFPITFVVKSENTVKELKKQLKKNAEAQYPVKSIVKKYINCIEEIINIPILIERFEISVKSGYLKKILTEIIIQSKVEFNYEEE